MQNSTETGIDPNRTLPEPRTGRWERVMMRTLYDPFFWLAERIGMAGRRASLLARAEGTVLEIGAGTGLNVPHWPESIDELVVTEPVATLIPRIERRLRGHGRPARVVAASAERLPLTENSVDTIVSTMVLCSVDDVGRALSEARRVLRPGGRILFIEHVRADGGWRERAQDLVHRAWRAFGGGCNCNRPTLDLIRGAGFTLEDVEYGRWRGMPFCVKPLVIGSARP